MATSPSPGRFSAQIGATDAASSRRAQVRLGQDHRAAGALPACGDPSALTSMWY